MSWLWDWVPWWMWFVIGGGGLAATMTFWLPIWTALPRPIKAAILAVGAVIGAYLAGRNRGQKNAADAQKERDAKAVKNRLEVENEVRDMSAEQRDKELKRWERD